MSKHLLSRVVMPEAKDAGYRDLFFRWTTTEVSGFGKNFTQLNEMHFNTWMNLFAAKKWFHYCTLENLHLGIKIEGDFSIEIIGSNRNVLYQRIDEKIFVSEYFSDGRTIFIPVKNPENYDAVYFIIRYKKATQINFLSAGWYTDTAPVMCNKLAIVTCTYKRENYINKTIDIFENYMDNNPFLHDRMQFFVIDNGQTLDQTRQYKHTKVFYNINAGGAGGFTRGLIEVCKAKESYTRCLFMDDDVEIIPESFYKTLILADYLKDKYQKAHINGAMLDLLHKEIFLENLAVQEGLWVHLYHGNANLYDYNEILRVMDIPEDVFHNRDKKVDAAWFYCCFPINKEDSLNNLPMPVFIRGDDVEWGWRNFDNVIISVNGICIWHSPFYYRVSKITDGYYLCRNMFIVNSLYTDNFKNTFKKLYTDKFEYSLNTYDYVSAKLINKALEDILKGTDIFYESPVEKAAELRILAREHVEYVSDEYELLRIKEKQYIYTGVKKIVNKQIKQITKLFPVFKCLLKKNEEKGVAGWYPPAEEFFVKKHVRVYDLLQHTYTMRNFDYREERILMKEFKSKIKEIDLKFGQLKNDYQTNFTTITSYDFWKKYLEL